MNTTLNIPSYIREFTDFLFYIRPEPTENEIVKSTTIVTLKPHEHIIIGSENVSGQYKGVFELGEGAIKTVNRLDKTISDYLSFKDLPKNNEQDCFYFRPPSSLDYPVTFTITVVYDRKEQNLSNSDNLSNSSISSEIWYRDEVYSKTYNTVIKGSWDIWSKAFSNYLKTYKS